ncbi:MAG: hypothetical protein DYG89_34045 [Caldilinea sp. CFX5]|nr:hypothetical protein [Caldilinea sp. CFX5]
MTATGCATPLTTVDLSMYLDGDADAAVMAHVRHCAECQRRAQRLQQTQQYWQTLFHRHSCPSSQELCDYAWELLPAPARQRVEQHLHDCPHCTHELLNNYVTQAKTPPQPASQAAGSTWWSTGIDQLRILVSHVTQPPTPAYAYAVRGEVQAPTFLFQLGETAMLYATSTTDPQAQQRRRLEIQVAGLPTEGMEIQLWQAAQLLQTLRLDVAGDAVFDNLVAGHYELILSAPQLKIHIPQVAIDVEWPTPAASLFDE